MAVGAATGANRRPDQAEDRPAKEYSMSDRGMVAGAAARPERCAYAETDGRPDQSMRGASVFRPPWLFVSLSPDIAAMRGERRRPFAPVILSESCAVIVAGIDGWITLRIRTSCGGDLIAFGRSSGLRMAGLRKCDRGQKPRKQGVNIFCVSHERRLLLIALLRWPSYDTFSTVTRFEGTSDELGITPQLIDRRLGDQ
jgi:hypothetical protein